MVKIAKCIGVVVLLACGTNQGQEMSVGVTNAVELHDVAIGIVSFAGYLRVSPDTIVTLDDGADEQLVWWSGGTPLVRKGRRGAGPGELRTPRTIVPVNDSTFAALERTGRTIHLFRTDGRFVEQLRFDSGPLLVAGSYFSGTVGEEWLVEDGAPRWGIDARTDSVPIWRLLPGSGKVQQWTMGGGGGRAEQEAQAGRVSVPIPLWQGDLVVRWAAETVLVLDPRAGIIRYFDEGVQLGRSQVEALHPGEVPKAVTDSIRARWREHPLPVFRAVEFDLPSHYAMFDHAVRGAGRELWLRTWTSPIGTEYAVLSVPEGNLTRRVRFVGDVRVLELAGDSILAVTEHADGATLAWFREAID